MRLFGPVEELRANKQSALMPLVEQGALFQVLSVAQTVAREGNLVLVFTQAAAGQPDIQQRAALVAMEVLLALAVPAAVVAAAEVLMAAAAWGYSALA